LERRFEPEVQRSLGRQLGEFVAWLNAVPRDGALVPAEDPQSRDLLEHADACLERLERAGLRPAPARDLFDRLCELWQTRPQLVVCHNDVYPQHVLVGDDLRLGVVDWDDMSVNEPIKDFTMWYEPFEGGFVYQDAYAEAFQAACTAYRAGFPAPDEERRLKLHALAGELSYDHDPQGVHVADWLARYGADFGLRQTGF
jgi:aminoglycoside phosphotransferase (APT) family kinase protein